MQIIWISQMFSIYLYYQRKKKMAPSTSGLGRKIFNLVEAYKASHGFESHQRYKTNTKKKSRLGRVVYVASFSILFKSKILT